MHTRNGALATIALLLVDALALSAGPNSSEPAISSVAEPTSAIRPADQQAPSRRGIRFHGGTGRELGVVGWALERYRVADLDLPPVGISFHEDPSGCRDNSGFYARGQLDLCLQGQTRAYAR
ncbi:MAG TPA: hypothetical protein VE669_00580, partial [Actinomycetota bacterium]|nr:hypothetical protein [Actinomycetota bacterium]